MIVLRDYQLEYKRQVHAALARHQRVIGVAPTGSGKRILACWWACQIPEKGKRLGVVTDRQVLVDQMADECKQHGIEYGIVMASTPRHDLAPVQICSIQTLRARKWEDLPLVDWWIVDEAHKEPAAYGELFKRYPHTKCLGLTATPVGPNGTSLLGLYDAIVEPVKNTQLIAEDFLLRTQCWYASEPDLKGLGSSNGDWVQSQLGDRVRDCTAAADIFKWWEPYSDLQTLAFVPKVEYAYGLKDQFRQRGHKVQVIEGATPRGERQDILWAFSEGITRVIVSVDVLKEGFDSPRAQVGIDLQPTKQLRTFWQKVGRVKRPHDDQDHAIWLDFAGNVWRFPHPDEDPEWPQDNTTTTQQLVQRKREADEKQPWACSHCGYTLAPGERLKDGCCPSCGKKVTRPIRRVRMLDGSMKTVSVEEKRHTQRSNEDKLRAAWIAISRRIGNKGGSLHQAKFIFHKSTGVWPSARWLPHCPEYGSGDWKRRVYDVYPDLAPQEARTA